MAMVNCPGCDGLVSERAQQCPKCGIDIPAALVEKRAKERAEELRRDANSSTAREHYDDALLALRELETLDDSPETIRDEILKLEELRDRQMLDGELSAAERSLASRNYRQTVAHCNSALSIDSDNVSAAEMRQEADAGLCAAASRKRRTVAGALVAILLVAVIGAGAGAFFYNQSQMKKAQEHLSAGYLDRARSNLDRCITLDFLPFLASGRGGILEQIETQENLQNVAWQAKAEYERTLRQLPDIPTVKRYAGVAWKRVLKEVDNAERAGGDYPAATASYMLARELLPAAVAEGNCAAAADKIKKEHAADSIPESGWEVAMRKSREALDEFNDGAHEKAQRIWREAARDFNAAGVRARTIREVEAKRRAEQEAEFARRKAEEDRRRQEQERRRREEETRRKQAEYKTQAQTLARSLSSSARQTYAYREAEEAASDESWSRACEYYGLASRFKFTQSFSGRLGFTSKWQLDGNWTNEHKMQKSLSRDDIVYLFVTEVSDSGIDFFLKSPKGDQVWISDEDYEEVDSSGSWKIGAESKGRVSYKVKIEVYEGE